MLIVQKLGVFFTQHNTYRDMGYVQLFRTLHPNTQVDVLDALDDRTVSTYQLVYVICDYIYYTSRCISRKNYPQLRFILDECRKGVVAPQVKTIHPHSIDEFFYGRRGWRSGCLHCKIAKLMTSQEMTFIHLSSNKDATELGHRRDVIDVMDINVKIYSRIKISIKRKLKIHSDYMLFMWCSAFVNNHSKTTCIS